MSKSQSKESIEIATMDPAAVLKATSVAKTLTISDQHATIMLTTTNGNDDNDSEEAKKALLKLTLVPFHKADLLPPVKSSEADEAVKKAEQDHDDKEHSQKVLTFLSQFDWKMSSESGAEYSFYDAFYNTNEKEDTAPVSKRARKEETSDGEAVKKSIFKVELIYPASDRQLARAMPSPGFSMMMETPATYQAVTKPFIDKIVSSGSLSWLKNIVEVKKEEERLLWNADGWILNIDTK